MMYIVTVDREYTWHVGNKVPVIIVESITEVQADGHELGWLEKNVIGISRPQGRSVRVFRDIKAREIYRCMGKLFAERECGGSKRVGLHIGYTELAAIIGASFEAGRLSTGKE